MKHWPVPNSYSDELPQAGSQGAFWEDRTDRFNCGVDFYAPPGSSVIAIDGGIVLDKGLFTSPEINPYWNKTYYLVIKTQENIIYKYAELSDILVRLGEHVQGGAEIGIVGEALNKDTVTDSDPFYIRELLYKNFPCMLHLEMYKSPVMEVKPYSEGNFLGKFKPVSILDPNIYMMGVHKNGRY